MLLQRGWRGRAVGALGHGAYSATVRALREMNACPTPLEKAERVLKALNFLAVEVAAVLQAEASGASEEIAADELLPLFVFVLVRRDRGLHSISARLTSDGGRVLV